MAPAAGQQLFALPLHLHDAYCISSLASALGARAAVSELIAESALLSAQVSLLSVLLCGAQLPAA